jgi:DNA-binding IclR family transcriptional regulator
MIPQQPNQSLSDGIRCLQAVITWGRPVGVMEIARELGMEKTRVHRLLGTLAFDGFLRRDARRKYEAGPAMPVLGMQVLQGTGLFRRAIPHLENLRKRVQLMVAMGSLWERSVAFFYNGRADDSLEVALLKFTLWPASLSGQGLLLMAAKPEDEIKRLYAKTPPEGYPRMGAFLKELAKIRRQGYAFIDSQDGHHSLCLPLRVNPHTGISISGKITEAMVPELLGHLRQCVDTIDAAALTGPSSEEAWNLARMGREEAAKAWRLQRAKSSGRKKPSGRS